jgi:hypothetical protein
MESIFSRVKESLRQFGVLLIVCTEEGQANTQYEEGGPQKGYQRIEHTGSTLAGTNPLLKPLRQYLVQH